MSQSSVKEQVEELATTGFPVRRGIRMPVREGNIDPRFFGSDLWFSRWVNNAFRNFPIISKSFGVRFLVDACHGLPAFVVGVGPSLDDSIEELKTLKGRAIIIATDAALRALLANGITPDLVVSYDCKEDQNRLWQDIPKTVRIPAFLNSCAHPSTIDSWPGPILFYNQYHQQDDLCKRILPDVYSHIGQIPSGATVGNMAIFAAHVMACDPICCVGMDFCYQPVKGDVAAWRYRAQDWRWTTNRGAGVPDGWEKTEIKELYDNDDRLSRSFPVKGTDGKEYKSDPELAFYLKCFEDIMPGFKVPIVNCTPDGLIPKLKEGEQGQKASGFVCMTVAEAIKKYCKETTFQGGRHPLAHLSRLVPDPRRDMVATNE